MSTSPHASTTQTATTAVSLPRVAIMYCTQCRWMLRAAYFGQELLSTFGTQIGEIALIPATGGLFSVELTYIPPDATSAQEHAEGSAKGGAGEIEIKKVLLWDRKAEGGFPETKVLKQRVRDHIDPKRDLGHSDRGGKTKATMPETEAINSAPTSALDSGLNADAGAGPDVAAVPGQVKDGGEFNASNIHKVKRKESEVAESGMPTVSERKGKEASAEGKRDSRIEIRREGSRSRSRGEERASLRGSSGGVTLERERPGEQGVKDEQEVKGDLDGSTVCEDCQ